MRLSPASGLSTAKASTGRHADPPDFYRKNSRRLNTLIVPTNRRHSPYWRASCAGKISCWCNKAGQWPALFLTLSLTLWQSLHYITLLYITLGQSFITLLYSTLLWGGLSLLYSTLLYLGAVFSLLYITLHYWGHYSLLYSTCVRFMVAGGDLFITPPLWHPASVAVRSLS